MSLLSAPWRITLLGGLEAHRQEWHITRFSTQKTAALLAYLAFYRDRAHPREVLIGLLWPEADEGAGRNRLSTALSSLRNQLEPPGTPASAVLRAERFSIGLNPVAVQSDVSEFEGAIRAALKADRNAEQTPLLSEAVSLYRGPLLPGYYDAWILTEAERLAGLFFDATSRLIQNLEAAADLTMALSHARQAAALDPLREEAHRHLMRLLAATGRPGAALGQYKEYERQLEEETGEEPSAALRALARQIEHESGLTASAMTASLVAPVRARETAAPLPPHTAEAAGALSTLREAEPAPGALALPALPLTLTRFFGREQEIAALSKLLLSAEVRLLTLTGSGGTGKTRLAIEVARRLRGHFPGAIWFVPLAELRDPARIAQTLLDNLRIGRLPQREPLEQIAEALSKQPCLVVLDNFEQLVEGGADLVGTLLGCAPSLTLLVTSRQLLSLTGEREMPLMPLPTPGGGHARAAVGLRQRASFH